MESGGSKGVGSGDFAEKCRDYFKGIVLSPNVKAGEAGEYRIRGEQLELEVSSVSKSCELFYINGARYPYFCSFISMCPLENDPNREDYGSKIRTSYEGYFKKCQSRLDAFSEISFEKLNVCDPVFTKGGLLYRPFSVDIHESELEQNSEFNTFSQFKSVMLGVEDKRMGMDTLFRQKHLSLTAISYSRIKETKANGLKVYRILKEREAMNPRKIPYSDLLTQPLDIDELELMELNGEADASMIIHYSTIIHAFVYLDILILKNMVHNHNISLYFCVCLILAMKYQELFEYGHESYCTDGSLMRPTVFETLQNVFSVTRQSIFQNEFECFSNLDFGLLIDKDREYDEPFKFYQKDNKDT